MRISTKCSIAVHALILLALFGGKYRVTSDLIAKSAGCNPVVIRRLMSALKKAGIISVSKGNDGAQLAMKPENISVWQVYAALEDTPFKELFGLHPHPLEECPVGNKIYELLEEPYVKIGTAMQQSMQDITLADILARYNELQTEL